MRIIGGRYRGRRLSVPKGLNVRPTADRIKESIFSIIGSELDQARVLDLFAGSGALGLEALSRGAAKAVFVDYHPSALKAITRNLEALAAAGGRVVKMDLLGNWGRLKAEGFFEVIFIDPPYRRGLAGLALHRLAVNTLAAPNALGVVEHDAREDLPADHPGWLHQDTRFYGGTGVSFFRFRG